MKKRLIALITVLLLALQLAAPALASDAAVEAFRSPQRLRVNGQYADCAMYNIDGSNYIKLRDLAYLLRGTENRFSVAWDAEAGIIRVACGEDYVPVGGELAAAEDSAALAAPGTQPLSIDGAVQAIAEYSIRDNNYFRLRDLAPFLGFAVDYDAEVNAAVVESADHTYVPGAGLWVDAGSGRRAGLVIEEVSAETLRGSLRCQSFTDDLSPLKYDALRFVSADGKTYETEGEPAMTLRFDGERAVLTLSGDDIPLVWALSPLSARSSVASLESAVRLEAGAEAVYGGTLIPAALLRPVSFSAAEVQKAASEGVLPLPADLGGEARGVRYVSESEYAAGAYRLIFEGERWSLCDANETRVYTAEGAQVETLYFPAALPVSSGETLLVTVEDYAVTAAESAIPKAKRYGQEEIGGVRYATDAERVDLTYVPPTDLDAVLPALQRLPALKEIELMTPDGLTGWDLASVARLRDALPEVHPHYSFELYGLTVSTDDEEIVFDSVPIGDEGAMLIWQALDVLRECKRFVLDGCGVSNWLMAEMRDAHPDTKVVWRIYLDGSCNLLTDETMGRLAFHVDDGNSYLLRYCTDITFLDVGHNGSMSDISFAAYMPNLECAIFSGAPLTDITPLAACQKIVWLELCFCGYLSDISVLENHPTLKYLNISDSSVADISVLDTVPLERFNCQKTKISREAENHFVETHPDCLSIFRNTNEYGYGWRYDDYGYHYFWYYRLMRDVFRYDDENFRCNHKGG